MPRQPKQMPSLASPFQASVPQHGRPILVESDNYLLRSLRATDAGAPFIDWLSDDDILRGLNLPPRQWTPETLRQFIASFDNITRHLIGIFDLHTKQLIGFYTLDVNLVHRTSQITAAIGDKAYIGKNVLYEATPVFVRYLFEKRNVDKVSARILSTNRRVLFNFMIPDVFVFEARLKQEVIAPGGKRADLLVFSAFKSS